jgi:CHAT domain-containing protein
VEGIGAILGEGKLLLGPEASEARVAGLVSGDRERFDVLHFATHALVDGQRPNCSALVLSQVGLPVTEGSPCEEPASDGLVTGEEISRNWKLDSRLVTLSACETGMGRNVHHEGVIGFSHPFLQAGTRSVLVSLWKVDDRATALLMERFYENWLGPDGDGRPEMTKASALQEARIWLRDFRDEDGDRPYAHPYFWSAFVLIGDPS